MTYSEKKTENLNQQIVMIQQQTKGSRKLKMAADKGRRKLHRAVLDGNRTTDPVLNFVIATEYGDPNKHKCYQYKMLQEQVKHNAGHELLVVQLGFHEQEGVTTYIRNIFLTTVRDGVVAFDVEKCQMYIPVESHYLVYQESLLKSGNMQTAFACIKAPLLTVGPLADSPLNETEAEFQYSKYWTVPDNAPCLCFFHPWQHRHFELAECGLNEEVLKWLSHECIRARTKKI